MTFQISREKFYVLEEEREEFINYNNPNSDRFAAIIAFFEKFLGYNISQANFSRDLNVKEATVKMYKGKRGDEYLLGRRYIYTHVDVYFDSAYVIVKTK